MKKLFVMLSILMMSVGVFADGNYCTVRDHKDVNGQVVLIAGSAQSNGNGTVRATVTFQGENPSRKNVSVIVSCYDALTDTKVDAKSATTGQGRTDVDFYNLKPNHGYYFVLSDAHCH